MIGNPRTLFRAITHRLADCLASCGLGFEFICRMALMITVLACLRLDMAAASKDPTLSGAQATSHAGHWTGSQSLGTYDRRRVVAPQNTKSTKLDSQLQQLENNTSKATRGKRVSSRSVPTKQVLASQGDKIDLRLRPQRKGGMSNQQGDGSGSRRYGPGRRVTEKLP
jgi:hypothetical protein